MGKEKRGKKSPHPPVSHNPRRPTGRRRRWSYRPGAEGAELPEAAANGSGRSARPQPRRPQTRSPTLSSWRQSEEREAAAPRPLRRSPAHPPSCAPRSGPAPASGNAELWVRCCVAELLPFGTRPLLSASAEARGGAVGCVAPHLKGLRAGRGSASYSCHRRASCD